MRWKKQYYTKHLKVAGLCLASMFVLGMALAVNASAVPLWLLCLEGSGLTKYSSNQCTEASSFGKWQSLGLSAGQTDTVRLLAFSLRLEDTGAGLAFECPDAGVIWGSIEGTNKGKIKVVEFPGFESEGCKVLKGLLNCRAGAVEKMTFINLPWTTEIFATEGRNFTKITSSSGKTGWSITCGGVNDTCEEEENKPEIVELENGVAKGVLLVSAIFEKKGKKKCSLGGAGAGVLGGLIAILLWNGNGLRAKGEEEAPCKEKNKNWVFCSEGREVLSKKATTPAQ